MMTKIIKTVKVFIFLEVPIKNYLTIKLFYCLNIIKTIEQ